jgi:hypothetical protein
MYGWLCGLMLALLLMPHDCRAARLDPSSCVPSGLATDDNDIRLDDDRRPPGKPISLPEAVADRVRAAAAKMLARTLPELAEGLTCAMLLRPVYHVSGFGRANLFVAEADIPTAGGFFFVILHDPATGATTQDPPWIGSKWPQVFGTRDPLVRIPLVSSDDLFQNGRRQVVFEERVHNGTLYNGVIYHYFDVGAHMELIRVLARETRVLEPLRAESLYLRELAPMAADRMRLDMYETPIKQDGNRQQMGYSVLDRAGPGAPFHVTERHPLLGVDPHELVTFCETSGGDDTFLRKGCDFYY